MQTQGGGGVLQLTGLWVEQREGVFVFTPDRPIPADRPYARPSGPVRWRDGRITETFELPGPALPH